MTGAAFVLWLRQWLLPKVVAVLTFNIALPLWVFLVAGGWFYFDKHSAIRTAVNQAVTKLVAGAEIEALNAKLAEEQRIRQWSEAKEAEANRIAETERQALQDLETNHALSRLENRKRKDDLAQLETRPLPDGCRVDQYLLERLRNR